MKPGYEVWNWKNGDQKKDFEWRQSAGYACYLWRCSETTKGHSEELTRVWQDSDGISEQRLQKGYKRDEKQCWEKFKQLKKKYKEVVHSLCRSGAGVDSDNMFEESGI